jgi:hypothetical protein
VVKTAWDVSYVHIDVENGGEGPIEIRLTGNATFLRLPKVLDTLQTIPHGRAVELDLSGLRHLDHACRTALLAWAAQHGGRDDTSMRDALVADGLHARTDGFTSLAVLVGTGGVALGWKQADPIVGLLITVAMLAVLRQAAREVYRRLMDAVDPALIDQAEATLRATAGVLDVGQVRMRWIGHRLRAECEVIVDGSATAMAAHQAAVEAEHALIHAIPRLSAALVHTDPEPHDGLDHHAPLADHR